MENFLTKIILLVTCFAAIVSAQIINKLDTRNAALDTLQRYVWYRRKDMIEIRELILTIPYFKDIGGEDEDAYFTKFNGWYEANKNTFNQRRRDLESLEEKINITFSYSDSTVQSIKNLAEIEVPDKQLFLQSLGSRWNTLTDRMHSLEELVMAVRVAADKASSDLGAERRKYSQSYHDFLDVKVILENELEVANNRTSSIGALEDHLQKLDNRLSNIKTKADEILSKGSEFRQKIESVKERTKTTKTEIEELIMKLSSLKENESTQVGGGLNYIKSVKTASGRGKRIRLTILSD